MKRKIWLGLIVIFLCLSMIGSPGIGKVDAQPAVPEDTSDPLCGDDPTLIGCWLFNESTGTATADGSIHTNDGTLILDGGTMWTTDRLGNPGKALHFDGGGLSYLDQSVRVQYNSTLNIVGDITIAAWVKPELLNTQYILKHGHQSSVNGYELGMAINSGTTCTVNNGGSNPCPFGRFKQSTDTGGTADAHRINSKHNYTASDDWTFYAVTKTDLVTDTVLTIYTNGQFDNRWYVADYLINSNTEDLGLGAQYYGGVASGWFRGSLDDIRLYNRALSASQILALFSAPTAVNLVNFSTTSIPHAIQLGWQSAHEINLLGFNLYRAEALDGLQVKINPQLIPAVNPGQFQGNAYQYLDATAKAGKTYYYWVEWVGNSSSEQYGPVAILASYWLWLPIGLR